MMGRKIIRRRDNKGKESTESKENKEENKKNIKKKQQENCVKS